MINPDCTIFPHRTKLKVSRNFLRTVLNTILIIFCLQLNRSVNRREWVVLFNIVSMFLLYGGKRPVNKCALCPIRVYQRRVFSIVISDVLLNRSRIYKKGPPVEKGIRQLFLL